MLSGFAHKQGMFYVGAKGMGRRSRAKDLAIQVDFWIQFVSQSKFLLALVRTTSQTKGLGLCAIINSSIAQRNYCRYMYKIL